MSIVVQLSFFNPAHFDGGRPPVAGFCRVFLRRAIGYDTGEAVPRPGS